VEARRSELGARGSVNGAIAARVSPERGREEARAAAIAPAPADAGFDAFVAVNRPLVRVPLPSARRAVF